MAVFPRHASPFVIQLYIAGEPQNGEDLLLQHIPTDLRPLVTAEFRPLGDDDRLGADWDIVLGLAPS